MRTLRIKYNQLSRVPAAVMRLPQLATLELSGNQIVKLDSTVAKVRAGPSSSDDHACAHAAAWMRSFDSCCLKQAGLGPAAVASYAVLPPCVVLRS